MSDAWLAQQGENQIDVTEEEHPSFDARTRALAAGVFHWLPGSMRLRRALA